MQNAESRYGLEGLTGSSPRHKAQQVSMPIAAPPAPMVQGLLRMALAAGATSAGLAGATVYALMLVYCLCYFPTIALTNSLTFRQLTDAGGEFPFMRMLDRKSTRLNSSH